MFFSLYGFEGKIFVGGGENINEVLKSVEAYDYYENNWTHLPDMIVKRNNHALVSMGIKMFVTGGVTKPTCKTFDS